MFINSKRFLGPSVTSTVVYIPSKTQKILKTIMRWGL